VLLVPLYFTLYVYAECVDPGQREVYLNSYIVYGRCFRGESFPVWLIVWTTMYCGEWNCRL